MTNFKAFYNRIVTDAEFGPVEKSVKSCGCVWLNIPTDQDWATEDGMSQARFSARPVHCGTCPGGPSVMMVRGALPDEATRE